MKLYNFKGQTTQLELTEHLHGGERPAKFLKFWTCISR